MKVTVWDDERGQWERQDDGRPDPLPRPEAVVVGNAHLCHPYPCDDSECSACAMVERHAAAERVWGDW